MLMTCYDDDDDGGGGGDSLVHLLLSLCLLEWIRFGFGLGFSIEFEFLLIGSCKIVFLWVWLCVVIMQKVFKKMIFFFFFLCGGLSFWVICVNALILGEKKSCEF